MDNHRPKNVNIVNNFDASNAHTLYVLLLTVSQDDT
jgi:hypothetical protein